MTLRRSGLGAAVAGLALLAVGCSSALSRSQMREQLTSGANAMSPVAADCVLDRMEAAGIPYDLYRTPTPDEQEQVSEIAAYCVTAPR